MKTDALRVRVRFAGLTLLVLLGLMWLTPTLHMNEDGALLFALSIPFHGGTAIYAYLVEHALYGKAWYKAATATMFALFAFCLWLAFEMSRVAPGLPMQFFYLVGASGVLNGLGILVFRLHVPVTQTAASGKGAPAKVA